MNQLITTKSSALVLLHGWGVNQAVWQNVKNQLSADIEVLTPDLPGFGAATNFPAPYTLDAAVAQLAQHIPDNSYLCGWSLGGLLAIALASQYPHKVKQLALVGASPCFLAQQSWPGMSPKVLQQFSVALSQNLSLTVERFLAIQALGSSSARDDIKQLKQAILAYDQPVAAAVQGALQLLADTDLRAEFSALTVPVVGCYGRLDSLVPVAVIEHLQQLQPKAHFCILPQASHAPFISHRPEFMQWLRQWLGL